jgi:hypothetical protein
MNVTLVIENAKKQNHFSALKDDVTETNQKDTNNKGALRKRQ